MNDYKFIKLKKLSNDKKKYMAIFRNNKKGREKNVKFGSSGYSDYTIHRDDKRKELYIKRHKKNENWDNPLTAGFWSRWILWNLPTIRDSLKDTKDRLKRLGYL
jgi:rhamnogalacturonyl hydrolase YesR